MGYMHIDNLYKNKSILMFKECYALEKIHGTSTHIKYKDEVLSFSSGGVKHDTFINLFDKEFLEEKLAMRQQDIIIFGEAYGGKIQGMSDTYGKILKFICFDIKVDDTWLSVTNAAAFASSLNLEFVSVRQIPCDIEHLNAERDADSVQAVRNWMGEGHKREGIVIKPIMELRDNKRDRFVVKYKCAEFTETKKIRIVSPEKLQVLKEAKAIATEWVTEQRLMHVLDKVFASDEHTIKRIIDVIRAMTEDVYREAKGEIVESQEAKKAIGKKTASLFKDHLNKNI